MLYTVKGLVLRETAFGENAKYVNILTAELGLISAFVRGATKNRGRFIVSARIFCYSEFVLYESGGKYTLNEATLIENYFSISDDFNRLTVGTYILNTAEYVAREEQREEVLLRLALNTLWALAKYKERDFRLIKGVYELRLSAVLGMAPNLVACPECGRGVENESMLLNVMEGTITCRRCYNSGFHDNHMENDKIVDENRTVQLLIPLNPASLLAMQHALYADMAKLFSFSLAKECLPEFSEACEKYLENHLEHHFAVLDMLIY